MSNRLVVFRGEKKIETFKRKCLGPDCNKTFKTDNKFIRVCPACKGSETWKTAVQEFESENGKGL